MSNVMRVRPVKSRFHLKKWNVVRCQVFIASALEIEFIQFLKKRLFLVVAPDVDYAYIHHIVAYINVYR